MKNFIEISFPENIKIKRIVIKRALVIENPESLLIEIIEQEKNDKQTCLLDHQYHYLTDLRLVSMNDEGLGEKLADKHQKIVLRGYYHKKNQNYVVPCLLTYNIYDRE